MQVSQQSVKGLGSQTANTNSILRTSRRNTTLVEPSWTLECVKQCRSGYNKQYKAERLYEDLYSIRREEEQILTDIIKNRLVEADSTVYADFPNYKSVDLLYSFFNCHLINLM